jgi:hypothetical protein
VAAAIVRLDKAATMDVGLPQYFRGLALAELLRGAAPSEEGLAAPDTARAEQVIADLEFVLAARDQFPVLLLRAAYQGLARAYLVLGRQQQAAEALRRSGLGPAATDRPPMFTSFSVTARDGMRVSAPGLIRSASWFTRNWPTLSSPRSNSGDEPDGRAPRPEDGTRNRSRPSSPTEAIDEGQAFLALRQAGFRAGQSVLAPGVGGSVGNATLKVARALGASQLVSTTLWRAPPGEAAQR